jgi:hypothetical protein
VYSFLTSAIGVGEWLAPGRGRALALGKGLPVPIGWASELGWTRSARGKIVCLPESNPGRPVLSQTLY